MPNIKRADSMLLNLSRVIEQLLPWPHLTNPVSSKNVFEIEKKN